MVCHLYEVVLQVFLESPSPAFPGKPVFHQKSQIVPSRSKSATMDAWSLDFTGPMLLYTVLNERFERNPPFLRRNLRQPRLKKEVLSGNQVHLHIQGSLNAGTTQSKSLFFYLLGLHRGKLMVVDESVFMIESADESCIPFDGMLNIPLTMLKSIDSLVLMLIVGERDKDTSGRMSRIVSEFCTKTSEMFDSITHSQYTNCVEGFYGTITVSRCHAMIDLQHHLRRAKYLAGHEVQSVPNGLRFFLHPATDTTLVVTLRRQSLSILSDDLIEDVPEYEATIEVKLLTVTVDKRSQTSKQSKSHRAATKRKAASTSNLRKSLPSSSNLARSEQDERFLVYHYCSPNDVPAASVATDVGTTAASAPAGASVARVGADTAAGSVGAVSSLDKNDPSNWKWIVRQQVFHGLSCPWCGRLYRSQPHPVAFSHTTGQPTAETLQAFVELVLHLTACHYHHRYELARDTTGNLHIIVRRQRTEELEPIVRRHSTIKESVVFGRAFAPPSFKVHLIDLPTHKGALSLPETDARSNTGKGKPSNGTTKGRSNNNSTYGKGAAAAARAVRIDPRLQPITVLGRPNRTQYFHAITGQPVAKSEVDYDSDADIDLSFDLMRKNDSLVEFSDITMQEKVFFQLWNTHLATFPPHGDRLLPVVCERFLQRFLPTIVREKLRYLALLHFINLWDFGLLLSEEVEAYMRQIDEFSVREARRQQQVQQTLAMDDE